MPNLLAISGSLRSKSFNTMLLRAAVVAAPAGTAVATGSIRDIPLYDGDVDAAGQPPAVRTLKEQIAAADGVLLVTPEYNHSIPGVFKNAIDWVSRPVGDIPRVFGNRPFGVIGATTGSGGTTLAQEAWLPIFRGLGVAPFCAVKLMVTGAAKVFDDQGGLQDAAIRLQLEKYLGAFAQFVAWAESC
jgi:chromate reductase, NAD(P)H dehydrogenase (quinone)